MNDSPIRRPPLPPIREPLNSDVGLAYTQDRIIETRRSATQEVQVVDTPAFGRLLRLDGVTMTSERDEYFYHENLVHVPAVAHAAPHDAAIIGGGDGGALRELLKHPCIRRVDLVEIDATVVEMSRRHLSSISQNAFQDARVTLHFADGRTWLRERGRHYDLILLDLTDPVGAAHGLFTAEFYSLCLERLGSGGMLAVHAQSPVSRPKAFARIILTLRSVFANVRPYLVFVPTYGTWFAMATASPGIDPLDDTAEAITARLHARQLGELRFYNAATHFAAFALPNFVHELLRTSVPLVTDGGPRFDDDPEFSVCGPWATSEDSIV